MATGLTLYRAWVADGKPFQLAHPLVTIRDLLRGYGYTVYDIGDDAHLTRTKPEDHTPYSQTGWPQSSPYGWGFALDIMPPTKVGLPSLAELGAQLYADRQAGIAGVGWLKYMNWEPGDGGCYQDRWQPTHARSDSSDRGHIHLSARTDYQTSTAAVGYDPVARARGEGMDVNLSRGKRVKPKLVGDRDAGTQLDDVWAHEVLGKSAVDGAKSERGLQLDRIEGFAKGASAADVAAALVADPTFLAAVKGPSAAEVAAELIRQLGGSAPTT